MTASGLSRTVLIIGAETLSRWTNWQDRGTCILFGDGAGAVVLKASQEPGGVISSYMRSDGSGADLLIIPTQAEYFSAYALRNMMGIIRRVRQDSNPILGYRILITLLDRRNRTHRNIQEQLQNTFGEGLFKTVIEIDTKLRESPIAGLPITRYRPGARGSQQYRDLAQELMEYVKEKYQQAA